MYWLLKCAAFQVLGRVPGGQSLYHAGQRLFTRSTVQTEARLLGKIRQTLRYWNWLASNTPADWLKNASHLDLGAGWIPSVPMTFHALGVPRQFLVDIAPHMQPQAVIETASLFRGAAKSGGLDFPRWPAIPERGRSLADTLESFGMTYAAPYDGLAEKIQGTVGFATGSYMLLHLDRATLVHVFRTVHRLLAPGGYFLAAQHLLVLFDGLHSRTSRFHYLRYGDWFWEHVANSPMMSYNRLRSRDYREALQEAGFELAHFEVDPGTADDLAQLKRAKVHPMFARYSPEELAERHLFFAARKPR